MKNFTVLGLNYTGGHDSSAAIMRNGKIAMKLDEDDSLIGVLPCQDVDNVLLASRNGKAIRFAVDEVRVFKGRGSVGVRGMRLLNKDYLVSMCVIRDPNREFVLSITENGYGKRTSVGDYRRTGRGGQGVANIETSDRNGLVVASFTVFAEDQLMLVTDAGKVIRIRVDGGEGDTIRVAGRKTQGVRLFEVDGTEKVVSVGVIRDADTDDEEEELGSEVGSDLDAELGAGDAVADTNTMQASAEGAETTDGIDTDGADADDADTNGADATSPNTDEAP